MDELVQWCVDRIEADADVMAIINGGVYGQPIIPPAQGGNDVVQDGYYAATPEAFDNTAPFLIRRCVSISRMPRTSHPSSWFGEIADYVEVYYYAPDFPAQRAQLNQILLKTRKLFTRVHAAYDGAGGIIEPANDMLPIRPTGEFIKSVMGLERFRVNCGSEWN